MSSPRISRSAPSSALSPPRSCPITPAPTSPRSTASPLNDATATRRGCPAAPAPVLVYWHNPWLDWIAELPPGRLERAGLAKGVTAPSAVSDDGFSFVSPTFEVILERVSLTRVREVRRLPQAG